MRTAPSQLVGRDSEIAEIEAMLAAAAEGAGSVVVVRGAAGAGKTALLDAAVHRARLGGFTVLRVRGSSAERELPFGLASRAFEPLAAEPVAVGAQSRSEAGSTADPSSGASRLSEARELPFARPLGEATPAGLHILHRALAHLASRAPVLLAVDDLQWADRQSLRWLSTLPQRVDHARIAVLLTVCPGEPCTDPAALDELLAASAVELHPADLGAQATAAVLQRALGTVPDASFVAAFTRETGGNPLVANELAAVLKDRAIVPGAHSAAVLDTMLVPRLASAVHARLRRISPQALGIARAVAVLGDEADVRRVTGVCGAEQPVVLEVTAALGRAGLLRVADESVAFAQPLLRDTLLQHMPCAERQSLHAASARVLRATGGRDDEVARHLLAAPAPVGPWAVGVLREAAAAARGRGEPGAAAACLRRALSEPVPEGVAASLRAELGRTESYLDLDSAIRHLTEAVARPAEPQAAAGAVRELAALLAITGRHEEAVGLVAAQGETALTEQALYSAELRLDRGATAQAAGEVLARLPRPVATDGVDEGRYLSLLAVRAARSGRSRARAVALAQQALAVLPVTPEAVRSVLRAVLVLAEAGRIEEAHERCDALVGHAERWGHRPCLAAARSLRGAVAHRLGRIPEAAEDTRGALEVFTGCGAPRHRGEAVGFLARLVEVLIDSGASGAVQEAADLLRRSELCDEVPDTWAGGALLLARGRLRIACGQPAEGLRDLQAVGRRLAAWGAENPAVAPWRSPAALALTMLGEPAQARRHAAEAVEQARRWGAPGPLGSALRTLGTVLGGTKGLAFLDESVGVLERSSARLELARSQAELGTALSRAGRPVPARRALRAALELAEECSAVDLARRSRVELSACGGRPPRSSGAQGVAALTAAELRTATLAAEGKTNRELAEALRVQLRTVEVHLTNVYRKLGIQGRGDLPAALRGDAAAPVGSRGR